MICGHKMQRNVVAICDTVGCEWNDWRCTFFFHFSLSALVYDHYWMYNVHFCLWTQTKTEIPYFHAQDEYYFEMEIGASSLLCHFTQNVLTIAQLKRSASIHITHCTGVDRPHLLCIIVRNSSYSRVISAWLVETLLLIFNRTYAVRIRKSLP